MHFGRRLKLATFAALLAVFVVIVVAASSPGEIVRVSVPAGSSLRAAADSLSRAGVISSAPLFRAYASLTKRDRSIKAGTYELSRTSSWRSVMDALTSGRGVSATVTVPEGFALAAIESLLVSKLELAPDSVAAAVRDSALLERMDVPTPMLEGYLFPDTYTFPLGTSARSVVSAMVDGLSKAWDSSWNAQLEVLNMTRHEILTIASIIEREAVIAAERPLISAVYHNRLRVGMPLQADPTVQYARGQHTDRVLYSDLLIDSPYNTYKYANLPPGPIASPGRLSMEAALFPADVPYRFFVAHPDGHHEFRVTFAEHQEARQLVQRARQQRDRENRR